MVIGDSCCDDSYGGDDSYDGECVCVCEPERQKQRQRREEIVINNN